MTPNKIGFLTVYSLLPDDHGANIRLASGAKFFELEFKLALVAHIFLLLSFVCGLMYFDALYKHMYRDESFNPISILICPALFSAGMIVIRLVQIRVFSLVTNEHYSWMLSVHSTLGLPPPTKNMRKIELRDYVTKAYEIEAKKKSLLDDDKFG